jgi:WD40 repeat protein
VSTPGKDRYGDPLPEGAVARLGSIRFRGGDRPVSAMRFSPDGQTLLTVSQNWLLRLWETKTGRLLHEVLPGSGCDSVPIGIAFSPDGQRIALTGIERGGGDKTGNDPVRLVVDAATGKEVRRLPATDRDVILAMAYMPDGKALMSLAHGGVFRIEEIASGAELVRREFPRDEGTLVLSPDGNVVAIWTGANTRKLYLWDRRDGTAPRELKVPRERVGSLAFSPNGQALVACGDFESFVYEWDVATGDLRNEIALRDDITPAGLAFTPDGRTIAVTDSGNQRGKNFNGGVLLLERGTGKLVRELPTPGVQAIHVACSPDGRWLAASGGVGVHVWDVQTGEEVAVGSAGHQNEISQIVTAPGGLIATASLDHTVRLWDAATGTERRRLAHGNWVPAIAVSPDGRFLASSSLDDSVRLWDLPDGKEVYKLPGHGALGGRRTVGFTPDSRRFLSWGDDLYLRIGDIRTGKVLIENTVRPPGVGVPGNVDPGGRDLGLMLGAAGFAPDGRRLVGVLGGSIHIIDTATGRIENSLTLPGGPFLSLAVAPDGRTFATSAPGRSVRRKLPDGRVQSTRPDHHPVCLVELATGKILCEMEMPSADNGPVAFSADGKRLAVGSGRGRGEVRLLDTATHETVAVLADIGSKPHAMAFAADGKSLITGLNDGTALVWDLARVLAGKARKGE